jgi:hypothetical protein
MPTDHYWRVVLDGIEPSFSVCKTGVVAVGPQDYEPGFRDQAPVLRKH